MLNYWVWLAECKGLQNQTRLALLRRFGTAEAVYCADEDELLLTKGVDRKQIALLRDHDLGAAERILADCQRLNIRILTCTDSAYPGRLRNIYDPPTLLYVRGSLPFFDDEAAIAVVGTRACTPYGLLCAEKLSYGLAKGGAMVVTGLARGIDTAAARSALRAGGSVVGVLGNGVDVIYPKENRDLYEDVAASGALLSEYPPGTKPAPYHFPIRNRILSGLSLGVLVVEAPERSGALITAEDALEQGRDVFAVPGPIDAPGSVGCNRLIRAGAGLVREAADILWEYEARFPTRVHLRAARQEPPQEPREAAGETVAEEVATQQAPPPPETPSVRRSEAGLTDDQLALMALLSDCTPCLADELIDRSGIPTRRVLSALTVLEIDGFVRQHSGKRYTRTVEIAE